MVLGYNQIYKLKQLLNMKDNKSAISHIHSSSDEDNKTPFSKSRNLILLKQCFFSPLKLISTGLLVPTGPAL